jgi:hypothetical protein
MTTAHTLDDVISALRGLHNERASDFFVQLDPQWQQHPDVLLTLLEHTLINGVMHPAQYGYWQVLRTSVAACEALAQLLENQKGSTSAYFARFVGSIVFDKGVLSKHPQVCARLIHAASAPADVGAIPDPELLMPLYGTPEDWEKELGTVERARSWVMACPYLFSHCSEQVQQDRALALHVLQAPDLYHKFKVLPPTLMDDEAFADAALSQVPHSYAQLSDRLKQHPELAVRHIEKVGWGGVRALPEALVADVEFFGRLLGVCKWDPPAWRYLPSGLKSKLKAVHKKRRPEEQYQFEFAQHVPEYAQELLSKVQTRVMRSATQESAPKTSAPAKPTKRL